MLIGLAHSSGWINVDTFLWRLEHFAVWKGCFNERPHLLLLDNHSIHRDLKMINFSRDNRIVIINFPPHFSQNFQPLGVSIFGPFKEALQTTFNDWHDLNPCGRKSIHQTAKLAKKTFERAFTPSNIASSCLKCGIYLFDRNFLTDNDFRPSYATGRPQGDYFSLKNRLFNGIRPENYFVL